MPATNLTGVADDLAGADGTVTGSVVVGVGVVVPTLPCDAIETPVQEVRPAALSEDTVTVVVVKVLMADTKIVDALAVVRTENATVTPA